MGKPILSLDFDGVCHSYTSGWKGATSIPDDVVPGLFEFLEEAVQHFDVQIYSSRSNQEGGIEAMMAWFIDQRKKWRASGGQGAEVVSLSFPKEKPSAMIGIDDRVLTFDGTWPSIEALKSFKPWNKRTVSSEDQGLVFCVESESDTYRAMYTYDEACQVAKEDSIQFSSFVRVRHHLAYTPRRIYYCGDIYEKR